MKKNLLWFFVWVLSTIIVWWIVMYCWKKTESSVENNVVSFEMKEKCLSYFDKYRDYIKEKYVWENEIWNQYLSDYEMFYNSELDSCIAAYGLMWDEKHSDWEYRPTYNYFIVDYLNWEKELYHCHENTWLEHTSWDPIKWGVDCINWFNDLKEKYKN